MRDLVVPSGCLGLLADYLAAANIGAIPAPPTYVILGSGQLPVSPFTANVPGFEIFRAPITNRVRRGDQVVFYAHLSVNDSHDRTSSQISGLLTYGGFTVGACGVMAGDATLASGTGTLIAVANEVPFAKRVIDTYSPGLRLQLSGTQGGAGLVLTSGGVRLIGEYLAAARAEIAPAPPSYVTFGTVGISGGYFATSVPGWEIARARIINRVRAGVGGVTWSFLLASGQGNGVTLRTFGVMAGAATAASGTGTLVAVGIFPTPIAKTFAVMVSGNVSLTVSGTRV